MKRIMLIILFCNLNLGCNTSKGTTTGNPTQPVEDRSASGAVAQAVGGTLSSSNANGSFSSLAAISIRSASTLNACPTYQTPAGAECAQNASSLWLDYNSCDFGDSGTHWHGVQAITMSTGSAACGTFPNPGANGTLYRQFVDSEISNTPSAMLITSRFATLGVIDHHTLNLGNFDNAAIAAIVNGGYGNKVVFDGSGARSSLTLAQRIYILGDYDHSITGTLSITESAGASTRRIDGNVMVYLNHLKVIGTTTFTDVMHDDLCCLPTSGTVQTVFSRGVAAPTPDGAFAIGKTETLKFTGCGTAELTSYDGTVSDVTLSRCF